MTDLELRTQADGSPGLRVLASRVETEYQMPFGREVISRGAFAGSLSRSDLDVVLTVEHDRRDVLARTPLTLRLSETRDGLVGDATLDPQDPLTAQTVRRIERGVLKEASFAFRVKPDDDQWSEDFSTRRINAADIHRGDLTLTIYGSNPATGATVTRSAAERRTLARAFSTVGWCGPALLRELHHGLMPSTDDGDDDACPRCDGTGVIGRDRRQCPDCRGTGAAGPDDDDADDQDGRSGGRGGRTDAEVAALGKKGLALWVGDHYAWPIADAADLKAAVQSFGRAASSAGTGAVRAWIIRRARALGRLDLLPAAWGVRRSVLAVNDTVDLLGNLHRAAERGAARCHAQAAAERAFLLERQAEREREWAAHPARFEQKTIFDQYQRLVS